MKASALVFTILATVCIAVSAQSPSASNKAIDALLAPTFRTIE
jgi:hypothetical protein